MKRGIYILILALITMNACANDHYYEYGKRVEVVKLNQTRSKNDQTIHYYKIGNKKVGTKDEIIVQCNDGVDCIKVLKKYKLLKISKLSNKLFLVKVTRDNLFKLSRELYNDKNIKLAHPNFIKEKKRR